MLREIDVDELLQGRRLNQASFSSEAFERPLERLHRCLFGREAATLHPLRAATAGTVAIRPPRQSAIIGAEREYLSSLHEGSLLSSRPPPRRMIGHREEQRVSLVGQAVVLSPGWTSPVS